MKHILFAILFTLILIFTPTSHAEILVKSGDSIAFMGDSITQFGTGSAGYVGMVESGLKANGIDIASKPVGISGNKSDQMLARLDKDVISKNPTWMTLSCGVNDVWHQDRNAGILLPEYQKNITEIVDRATKANIKVVILTATLINAPDSAQSQKLIPYNDFLRQLAKERNLPLADLNTAMCEEIEKNKTAENKHSLTKDGVHMNVYGNLMMARGVLRAFGLNDEQMKKAEDHWRTLTIVPVNFSVTLTEMEAIETKAKEQKKSVEAFLKETVTTTTK